MSNCQEPSLLTLSGNLKIQLLQNGQIIQNIGVAATSSGSFNWTIPTAINPGDNYKIKIIYNDLYSDESDQSFKLLNQSGSALILTSPNGGESWEADSIHAITWSIIGSVSAVDLYYSTNNGSSYNLIAQNLPAAGSYNWQVPNQVSNSCLVRANESSGTMMDTGNATFSITPAPSITVSVPNGGESWDAGTTQSITWLSIGTIANVKIEYSTNGGSSFTPISNSTPNDGAYDWTIPNQASDACQIRISDALDGNPGDSTDVNFAILPLPPQPINTVGEMNPGPNSALSTTSNFVVFNNALYFFANDGLYGKELWKYDGVNFPSLVYDIYPGPNSSNTGNESIIVFNNKLYFTATNGTNGVELWKYDGISNPTQVYDMNSGSASSNPNYFVIFKNKLVFQATTASAGVELGVYDGTNTPVMYDLYSGTTGSSPSNFCEYNNILYFSATFKSVGKELGKYDGTTAPSLAKDIYTGSNKSSNPANLTVFNGNLYFSATNSTSGVELWKYDGTNATLIDINPGSGSSNPTNLTVLGTKLCFTAANATSGAELFVYDGTNAPVLKDIVSGSTGSVPADFMVMNNKLIFTATNSSNGKELWNYDGIASPQIIADLYSGTVSSSPGNLRLMNGMLYFSAINSSGRELWKYDGTQPPQMIYDFNPAGDSNPSPVISFNNQIYFSATDGFSGFELCAFNPLVGSFNMTSNELAENHPDTNKTPLWQKLTPGIRKGISEFLGTNRKNLTSGFGFPIISSMVSGQTFNSLDSDSISTPSVPVTPLGSSPASKTFYVYGINGQLMAEYDQTGTCQRQYIYVGSMLLAERIPQTNTYYYYLPDQINSTRVITDQTGSIVYKAAHGPYGDIQKTWINTYDPKLQFSGKEREANTNLDYFGARYFESATNRFLSVDPIINKAEAFANPQQWNLYLYCGNNPITFFDPDGRRRSPVWHTGYTPNIATTQLARSRTNPNRGRFGLTRNNGTRMHGGTDIQGSISQTIVNAEKGVVTFVGTLPDAGLTVKTKTESGFILSYMHLSAVDSYNAQVGREVAEGGEIGKMGISGNANQNGNPLPDYNVHLHFRVVNPQGNAVDPEKWLMQELPVYIRYPADRKGR